MQRIFNLDPQLIQDAIILAVNIFILFLLGSYFLFNPVRKLLEDRKNKVQSDIEEAKKSKEEAEALNAELLEEAASEERVDNSPVVKLVNSILDNALCGEILKTLFATVISGT